MGIGNNKIIFNFNHHASFEDAKKDWDRRKSRINKNNLFIKMLITYDNEELIKRFDNLPYKNKVCFHPRPLKYKSIVFLPRYIWICKNIPKQYSNSELGAHVRNIRELSKSCDLLKMFCGEDDFIREK
ncbi:hypothetical protein CLAUR_009450 [Clostridium felsineum]|nr:hypothetical protein CLAUR_009450 [Clostridium felsineum]